MYATCKSNPLIEKKIKILDLLKFNNSSQVFTIKSSQKIALK